MQQRQEIGPSERVERRCVEAVVQTLAAAHRPAENLGDAAHDARNLVTALMLFCELLDGPGVLTASHAHYAAELRLVTAGSRRLVENLVALDTRNAAGTPAPAAKFRSTDSRASVIRASQVMALPGTSGGARAPIENLQVALLAKRGLHDADARMGIDVILGATGGRPAKPVQLSSAPSLIGAAGGRIHAAKNAAGGRTVRH